MENNKLKIGFIILRNVTSFLQNLYWINCYECIRRFYNFTDYPIVIIDDNSDYEFIKYNKPLKNTVIIQSEFKKRGEFLPYYYFLKYKFFDIAVIIHDSVFMNKFINFYTLNYHFIWEFNHIPKQIMNQEKKLENMITLFNNEKLKKFYKLKKWKGCFGCMMTINYNFLKEVNNKYNFEILIPHITNRFDRMLFERIIGILMQETFLEKKNISIFYFYLEKKNISILGNIHKYCPWGICFQDKNNFKHLPIIKIWTGR
tara:strand:+ start:24410 stop:25183 length:774 start_codon:yes stop_codon:yes gene_type:complete